MADSLKSLSRAHPWGDLRATVLEITIDFEP